MDTNTTTPPICALPTPSSSSFRTTASRHKFDQAPGWQPSLWVWLLHFGACRRHMYTNKGGAGRIGTPHSNGDLWVLEWDILVA